jgi:hypothetical protein
MTKLRLGQQTSLSVQNKKIKGISSMVLSMMEHASSLIQISSPEPEKIQLDMTCLIGQRHTATAAAWKFLILGLHLLQV